MLSKLNKAVMMMSITNRTSTNLEFGSNKGFSIASMMEDTTIKIMMNLSKLG